MEYTLYKPTKAQSGGAIKFNVQKSGKASFMLCALQIAPMGGSRVFDWEKDAVINIKMGLTDLGQMLAVIFGKQKEAKLFHKTERDNKVIEFTPTGNPDRPGYYLKVSHKCGDSEAKRLSVGVTPAEAMILKVYIESAIQDMLLAQVWAGERAE